MKLNNSESQSQLIGTTNEYQQSQTGTKRPKI